MEINIKKINKEAVIPTCGTEYSAGMDLYSITEGEIKPGENLTIHTGICIEIPTGYYGGLYPRSGIASKRGLRPANCVGVIDADYRGEIMVCLHNDSAVTQKVAVGDRVAQLIVSPFVAPKLCVTEELSDTSRGTGGFGHTGE